MPYHGSLNLHGGGGHGFGVLDSSLVGLYTTAAEAALRTARHYQQAQDGSDDAGSHRPGQRRHHGGASHLSRRGVRGAVRGDPEPSSRATSALVSRAGGDAVVLSGQIKWRSRHLVDLGGSPRRAPSAPRQGAE